MSETIFVSWERHQRSRSFCENTSVKLIEIISNSSGIARYCFCVTKTIAAIKENRPKVLIVQNPSIVLAFLSVLLKPICKYKLVVDAHNEAVIPYIYNKIIIRMISKFIIRHSNYTIVTNKVLADTVVKIGGLPVVLPDFIPNRASRQPLKLPGQDEAFVVTLISTYAADEPFLEVFEAFRVLGVKYQLKVTGRPPADLDRNSLPANVELLGFLSHEDYWEYLHASHILIDLTTMDNCLVCGAYEGIAIGKPIILSNNPASVSLFGTLAMHVENRSDAVIVAVQKVASAYENYCANLAAERLAFIEREKVNIKMISNFI